MHPCQPTFFFFNDTATTEIYTLSLHDALPISMLRSREQTRSRPLPAPRRNAADSAPPHGSSDRKSTRLNSSHQIISYAVFCLKKKNQSPFRLPSFTGNTIPSTTPPPSHLTLNT